jgi:galactonate dehydratase
MHIVDVNIYRVLLPNDEWMLVSIETDNHIVGWGEITDFCDDTSMAQIISQAKQSLIGKNPLHIMECTQGFHHWTYPIQNSVRIYATALSGIDQALWDIKAKHLGLPLYKLYGCDGISKVPLYANLNKAIRKQRDSATLRESGRLAREAGFHIVKCTPFDEINPTNTINNLEKGLERIEALTTIIPIEQIAIDCHQRFERYSLSRMAAAVLTQFGQPFWVEDPIDVLDYETMDIVCQKYPDIRWAAGEDALYVKDLFATMKSKRYDVIMPDVKYIGGPSAVKSIIQFAESAGFKISLHNPNGIIATAHSAHLSALCRSEMPLEYPFGAVCNRELLCNPSELVSDGYYVFSDEPGIGVEINLETMRTYAEVYQNGNWRKYV